MTAILGPFGSKSHRDHAGITAARMLYEQQDPVGFAAFRDWADSKLPRLYGLSGERLLELVRRYPSSRLARGCREYAAIRGGPYFRYDFWALHKGTRSPEGEVPLWRSWLRRYPDHPGADDAVHRLVDSLERQGRRAEALESSYLQQRHPQGDGDMVYQNRCQFLWLLDTGTTLRELQACHPEDPEMRYAASIRWARAHHYREALALTEGLKLGPDAKVRVDNRDFGLADQRRLWEGLSRLDPGQTPDRLELARRWGREHGWLNGYLLLHGGGRGRSLLSRRAGSRPDAVLIRSHYAQADPNFIALELLDPTPEPEALFWRTRLLHTQWNSFSLEESLILAGTDNEERARAWYRNQAESAASRLTREYPLSSLGDDAWAYCYGIDPQPRYLEQILRHYPRGDQAPWASQLLAPKPEPILRWLDRLIP